MRWLPFNLRFFPITYVVSEKLFYHIPIWKFLFKKSEFWNRCSQCYLPSNHWQNYIGYRNITVLRSNKYQMKDITLFNFTEEIMWLMHIKISKSTYFTKTVNLKLKHALENRKFFLHSLLFHEIMKKYS